MNHRQLYSHPDRSLTDHLCEVQKAVNIILSRHSPIPKVKTRMEEIVRLHDFGKATKFFQEYILYKPEPKYWPGRLENKRHTSLGLFASAVLKQRSDLSNQWLLHVGTSILGHHTKLPCRGDITHKLVDGCDLLRRQLDNLYFDELLQIIGFALDPEDFKADDDLIFDVADLYDEAFAQLDQKPLEEAIKLRLITQLCFSILLEADKVFLALSKNAQKMYSKQNTRTISPDLVDLYIKELDSSPLDPLRESARRNALKRLSTHGDAMLFTLTLPTGMGKTLTAQSLALQLKKQKKGQLLVVLPFLSIIDQTAQVYSKVLHAPDTDVLMQSHSLSERDYQNLEGEDASFFLDTWQSDVIITTFDQFLLALFSSRAKHQMRFHHLADSVIIFDEVQALPSHLWDIVRYGLKGLAENFNTHVIAMSATQPGFITDAVELTEDTKGIFRRFGRYQLVLKHEQDLSKAEFMTLLNDRQNELQKKRVLITCNTRRSARFIYDEVIREWTDCTCPIYFLSADVVPKDRLKTIEKLKHDYPQPCLIISTQVVEAGVDMDMDLVIRDFAPLDSLIQVAGRCNRNQHKPRCDVEIYSLVNDKGKRYSEVIYKTGSGPDISLQETRRVLAGRKVIVEEDVFDAAEQYFAAIRHHKDLGQAYTEDWAYFKDHVNVSKLLRGEHDKQHQLIVSERDLQQPALKDAIQTALSIEDRWEKRRALKQLAPRLAQVTVNVWAQRNFDPLSIAYPVGPFWFLKEGFYDENRGLDVGIGHSDDSNFL